MKKMDKKQRISFIIGIFALLIFVIGATYAYFSIGTNNTTTDSSVVGTTNKYGTASLTTNTSKLYLKFTSDEMSEDYQGTTYYANSDSAGTPLTTNPNYVLATASLADGDLPLDCEYNYKVTATVTKEINDGSDSDVKITIGSTTKTLKELTAAGTDGIVINGKLKNLVTGTNQTISLSSTVTNTPSNQNGLSGNSYTVTISPYISGNTKSFSCKLHEKTLAEKLIASGNLWESGLEGDGYRYIGSGAVGTSTNPNNFICFGTTDKSACTANQDKYMYRVIGVFSDANGDNHVKLIKYKQLVSAKWNTKDTNVNWEDSTLYASLNGTEFLTNTTYDYLQDTTWSNKIENWTWSAINTKTSNGGNGSNYYSVLTPSQIYLHEMNRSTKTSTVGEWTTPAGKIGLMYASDYTLSLGSSALAITGSTSANQDKLKTGWMHQSNNDISKSTTEWTLSRRGSNAGYFEAWSVASSGFVSGIFVYTAYGTRPVFYLTSNESTSSGDGSLENPFIISE
mgnify:CR=1 FL=1